MADFEDPTGFLGVDRPGFISGYAEILRVTDSLAVPGLTTATVNRLTEA